MVLSREHDTQAGDTQAGELAGIIEAYNEVTDRLKASHELLRSEVCRLREELHEKNLELQRRERLAALGEMAAGVAHEIRNPLGGIRLYTSLLEKDLIDLPQELSLARKINVGVQNLESIVGDILAFAGGGEPKCILARVGDIIDAALIQSAGRHESLGSTIHVDKSIHDRTVTCDSAQMSRAVLNVLLNALDAAGKGGSVWLAARESDGDSSMLSIDIEDDGAGLDSGTAERIFNPFYTTKDTGTGLGLAIVHRIAEMHGGVVSAGSRDGGGASFTICIPGLNACNEPVSMEGV